MLPLNLPSSLVDQVNLLVRRMATIDKSLASTRDTLKSTQAFLSVDQEELESLRLENAFPTPHLADCTTASLGAVSQSFEDAL